MSEDSSFEQLGEELDHVRGVVSDFVSGVLTPEILIPKFAWANYVEQTSKGRNVTKVLSEASHTVRNNAPVVRNLFSDYTVVSSKGKQASVAPRVTGQVLSLLEGRGLNPKPTDVRSISTTRGAVLSARGLWAGTVLAPGSLITTYLATEGAIDRVVDVAQDPSVERAGQLLASELVGEEVIRAQRRAVLREALEASRAYKSQLAKEAVLGITSSTDNVIRSTAEHNFGKQVKNLAKKEFTELIPVVKSNLKPLRHFWVGPQKTVARLSDDVIRTMTTKPPAAAVDDLIKPRSRWVDMPDWKGTVDNFSARNFNPKGPAGRITNIMSNVTGNVQKFGTSGLRIGANLVKGTGIDLLGTGAGLGTLKLGAEFLHAIGVIDDETMELTDDYIDQVIDAGVLGGSLEAALITQDAIGDLRERQVEQGVQQDKVFSEGDILGKAGSDMQFTAQNLGPEGLVDDEGNISGDVWLDNPVHGTAALASGVVVGGVSAGGRGIASGAEAAWESDYNPVNWW